MQTACQWPQAAGSDGEENDHSFVPSFLRLFLKPQVTQAWNLSIVITVEYGCVRVAHVKRAINRLDIWCAQQKPPYYAGWLKGGVDFLKKMRTRHLPARNIPSEFSDCTFLAFKLLLKIKKKMVGKFECRWTRTACARLGDHPFLTKLASNSGKYIVSVTFLF